MSPEQLSPEQFRFREIITGAIEVVAKAIITGVHAIKVGAILAGSIEVGAILAGAIGTGAIVQIWPKFGQNLANIWPNVYKFGQILAKCVQIWPNFGQNLANIWPNVYKFGQNLAKMSLYGLTQ